MLTKTQKACNTDKFQNPKFQVWTYKGSPLFGRFQIPCVFPQFATNLTLKHNLKNKRKPSTHDHLELCFKVYCTVSRAHSRSVGCWQLLAVHARTDVFPWLRNYFSFRKHKRYKPFSFQQKSYRRLLIQDRTDPLRNSDWVSLVGSLREAPEIDIENAHINK